MYPKKSLGQNFLINDQIIPVMLRAAELKKNDVVVEVGSGLGVLTKALIEVGAKVYAIEKDGSLITNLQKTYKNTKNIKLIHQDALFFDLDKFSSRQARTIYSSRERSDSRSFNNYKVVANLPFNIASPLIRKFLESKNQPELIVVMVQKEVAEKIVAQPGSSQRGILTLAVEFYAQAEIITEVPKTNFRPVPKVDAAILKIKPKPHFGSEGKQVEPGLFFKIVKAGFAAKRQQIHNSLSATLCLDKNVILDILKKSDINPTLRAEDLNLKQWLKLCQVVTKDDILKLNDQSKRKSPRKN